MTGKETAEMIMRGIHDPAHCPQADVDLTVKFIRLVAMTLAQQWKDDSHIDEVCGLLTHGFQAGRLALMATEKHLLILGSEGATKAKIPLLALK